MSKKTTYTMIVDSSFCPETKASGWAGWLKGGEMQKGLILSGTHEMVVCGSDSAEVFGVVEFVKATLQRGWIRQGSEILIQCDCVSVESVVNIAGAIAGAWGGGKRRNGKSYKMAAALQLGTLLHHGGLEARYRHVAGHMNRKMGGRYWCNIEVDRRAKIEMKKVRQSLLGEAK